MTNMAAAKVKGTQQYASLGLGNLFKVICINIINIAEVSGIGNNKNMLGNENHFSNILLLRMRGGD